MRYTLCILFLFLLSCTGQKESGNINLSGTVVAIADGDTFTLLTPENKQVKVRLHGIDCPERKQDFGQVAKQKLSDLIFGKPVRIEEQTIDRYKRTVAIAYDENDLCINEEMLRLGLAWHYSRYDKNPLWQELEINARKQKMGLWSHDDAIAPWEWRRR